MIQKVKKFFAPLAALAITVFATVAMAADPTTLQEVNVQSKSVFDAQAIPYILGLAALVMVAVITIFIINRGKGVVGGK